VIKAPVILLVADGWGLAKPSKGNAISRAQTPNFDRLWRDYPHCQLQTSGTAVGLPKNGTGGSEVGHLTMGAGRIVLQELSLIDEAIKRRTFFKNQVLLAAMRQAKRGKCVLHLMGLLSDAGIHSHLKHLEALLKMAKQQGLNKIFVHAFADGRDVPEKSLGKYLGQLENLFKRQQVGQLATIVGRYYAMDRDHNWQRTKVAYRLLVEGKGSLNINAKAAVKQQYQRGLNSDYYLAPIVLSDDGKTPRALIEEGDSVIFFNFRSDRSRQLTRAFWLDRFPHFKPRRHCAVNFVCLTRYDDRLHKIPVAFPWQVIKQNLGECLSKKGKKQLRMAETEKYAHVTYFFNAQRNRAYKGERRILVPSPKTPSYAALPAMSARELTARFLAELKQRDDDFVLLNFANPDLVGHSGDLKAAIKAIEVVDEMLGKIVQAVLAKGGTLIFTADHGNAEVMLAPNGESNPSHSTNPVPFILLSPVGGRYHLRQQGGLADVAPTILELLGLAKPKVMTGKSLLLE